MLPNDIQNFLNLFQTYLTFFCGTQKNKYFVYTMKVGAFQRQNQMLFWTPQFYYMNKNMICFTPQQVAFEKGYAAYTVHQPNL